MNIWEIIFYSFLFLLGLAFISIIFQLLIVKISILEYEKALKFLRVKENSLKFINEVLMKYWLYFVNAYLISYINAQTLPVDDEIKKIKENFYQFVLNMLSEYELIIYQDIIGGPERLQLYIHMFFDEQITKIPVQRIPKVE